MTLAESTIIISQAVAGLKEQSWGAKHAAAKAVAAMAKDGSDSLAPHAPALSSALLTELPGRLWDGKDSLLHALAALCTACPQSFQAPAVDAQADVEGRNVVSAVLAAAARANVGFRLAALVALEAVLKALSSDFFEMVAPMLTDGCVKAGTTPDKPQVMLVLVILLHLSSIICCC